MRLGLTSAAFYGRLETEEAAVHLRDFTLDTCEVFLETPSEYTADFGHVVRSKLGALHCTSVHPLGTQFEQQLFGRSRRQVEDAFRLFAGVCDAAREIGAGYYVFHGPFGVHAPLKPERIHALPQVFARMQEVAHARGVTVLWENVHWCALRSVEDVATLTRLLPDIGFVLDVKQANRAGVAAQDMLAAMGSRVKHVHALDIAQDGSLCLPGEGIVPWPQLMTQLKQMNYEGAVILEPYDSLTRDEAALRRSLAFLAAC